MWELETTHRWDKDHKHYEKKRPNELAAVVHNLQKYLTLVKAAKNSKCVQAGYLHHEPAGVIAIDQKGSGGSLQETRLYVYPDDATQTVYMLTIGDKDSQHSDIEFCKSFVVELLKSAEQQ